MNQNLFCSNGNNQGFSLLEVLIALTIFAVSALGIYGLLNESVYLQSYAQKRLELILASTNIIVPSMQDLPPSTYGWKIVEDNPKITACRITRKVIAVFGDVKIIEIEWAFKKDDLIVNYIFYNYEL